VIRYLLLFFYPLELLYRLGFWLVVAYKKQKTTKDRFPFKIISVGNLTVGGTGKSVVVPFLVDLLGRNRCAIVLRGYKGSGERSGYATLVHNGHAILATREQSGDEAMMYAHQLAIPVAVGADRAQACRLLAQLKAPIDYVILDDAYQNFSVPKDCEILLLDARLPFDNGHCLPLGRLREKDYTRADHIILTHADQVDSDTLEYVKRNQLKKFQYENITTGRHAVAGIYYENRERVMPEALHGKKFLVAAGVGSFKGVLASVNQAGCLIGATKQYRDHHNYTVRDIDELGALIRQTRCDGVITTAKDWVKLAPLLAQENCKKIPVFIIWVKFEFLTSDQQAELQRALHVLLNR
jgi:tetraacyldisaccharide 4'-kinase